MEILKLGVSSIADTLTQIGALELDVKEAYLAQQQAEQLASSMTKELDKKNETINEMKKEITDLGGSIESYTGQEEQLKLLRSQVCSHGSNPLQPT